MDESPTSLICHRCGTSLKPGAGDFYVVRIEAYADPSPPDLDAMEPAESIAAEYEALLAQMADQSDRELMDQVYRRLYLHLCGPCYRHWIENPAGVG